MKKTGKQVPVGKKVEIEELRKNDMIVMVREKESPGGGTFKDFSLLRVPGILRGGSAEFWYSWRTRYCEGKPQVEEGGAKLVLPFKKPENTGGFLGTEIYLIGKWDEEKEEIVEPER